MKALVATGKVDCERVEELVAMSREVLAEMKKIRHFAHAFLGIDREMGRVVSVTMWSHVDGLNLAMESLPPELFARLEVFAADWGPAEEDPLDDETRAPVYDIVESTFN